jgi:cytidylate kinase
VPEAPLVVAVDGPAGAGKSAAARALARRLGIPYLDTGAMYRAVAVAARREGVTFPLDEAGEARVVALAESAVIGFRGDPDVPRVILDGDDITDDLREPEISRLSSIVSAIPGVRRAMVRRQRELAALRGGVVEGRDIGTVVFPDARVKVFLTASPQTRARRRFDELRNRGIAVEWESVVEEQRSRDERDATRADSPLKPADGAAILDTSSMTLAEVVDALAALVRRAAGV